EGTPQGTYAACNASVGHQGNAFNAGSVAGSTFEGNDFDSFGVSDNLATYWSDAGNVWDGSSELPSPTPSTVTYAECAGGGG
ncbi:MAG: hypothetical protein H0V09_01575, partial [Gemmatimonadetes bacterium]|nr:hypothetical protein [Gemmatimonadota bacterium]